MATAVVRYFLLGHKFLERPSRPIITSTPPRRSSRSEDVRLFSSVKSIAIESRGSRDRSEDRFWDCSGHCSGDRSRGCSRNCFGDRPERCVRGGISGGIAEGLVDRSGERARKRSWGGVFRCVVLEEGHVQQPPPHFRSLLK